METVATICFVMLGIAALLFLVRLLRGPSLADRLVALESITLMVVIGIGVYTAALGGGYFLNVLVTAAIVGFVAALTVSRFIERRGAR